MFGLHSALCTFQKLSSTFFLPKNLLTEKPTENGVLKCTLIWNFFYNSFYFSILFLVSRYHGLFVASLCPLSGSGVSQGSTVYTSHTGLTRVAFGLFYLKSIVFWSIILKTYGFVCSFLFHSKCICRQKSISEKMQKKCLMGQIVIESRSFLEY